MVKKANTKKKANPKENKGGRPPLFSSIEELEEAIWAYFNPNDDKKYAFTITGLALHLGFESRQSFYDYEKNEVFSYTIKRARLRIESEYEASLYGSSAAGPIFALKNLGWSDKQELEHSGEINSQQIIFQDISGNPVKS